MIKEEYQAFEEDFDQAHDERLKKVFAKLDNEFPAEERILRLEEQKAKENTAKALQELEGYDRDEEIIPPTHLDEAAYYGLTGELVKIIEPNSETDPVAILVNFLTAFGSIVGARPFFEIESTEHKMRLFCVLVGDTAKARKGTSWDYIKYVFANIDPLWKDQVTTGLNSGEGLIWAVRDPIYKKDKNGNDILVDEGVKDKRVFII